jgi:MarR family transcriptional regulator, temperature-dependent positive regulator of motility
MSKVQTSGPTVLLTRLAWRSFTRHTPERLGIKLKEYFALRELLDEGRMTQGALCGAMRVDANYMVLMLNDLEDAGYVERKRDPADRRRHIVELTPAGMAAIERAERAMDELEDEVLGPLSGEEREALRGLLDRAERG